MFFFYLSCFFPPATLRASWTELSPNRPHSRKWVRFENVVRNLGHLLPVKIGGPKTTCFRRLRNVTAKLTAFRSETWHRQPGKCVGNYKGSPTSPKKFMNFGPKRLKLDLHLPTLHKFCVLLHCQAFRRGSANRTQPHFAKRWTVNRANKLPQKSCGCPSQKWGQKLLHC